MSGKTLTVTMNGETFIAKNLTPAEYEMAVNTVYVAFQLYDKIEWKEFDNLRGVKEKINDLQNPKKKRKHKGNNVVIVEKL